MANPVLTFWWRIFGRDDEGARGGEERSRRLRRFQFTSAAEASETIFLILRRMRVPLIVLIVILAISVLGLTLIPGEDLEGRPYRMGFFDAFYVISYTASTIGFGEIPYPFTYNQRMWVTISIYLTVIGWAYAIGSLLALLQDRAFRQALAFQRFTRKVARLREPFLLIAGYGQTGELLGRAFDDLGRRFVVIDRDSDRIDDLELASYHADVPALVADAADPAHLGTAGLDHAYCEGVLALTDRDEANLAISMAATLLRPDLPVIARTTSPEITQRMHAFGTPTVINPFDRFGDHLRIALRAPASYQLMTWLSKGPGAELPARGRPPTVGRWVVCGYGRFGRELTADLRTEGLDVTIVSPTPSPTPSEHDPTIIVGSGLEPAVMEQARLNDAVGFVAGTDNDTTNLSLIAMARRVNPSIFVAARENRRASAPLFAAMNVNALLVPSEVVAHDVYAQLSTPLLWRFLHEMPAMGDGWAAQLIERLTARCGPYLQAVWVVPLTATEAPAMQNWMDRGGVRLGDLLRNPEDRSEPLHAVPLLLLRGDDSVLAPDDDFVVTANDEILLAGWPAARRALDTMLMVDASFEYVMTGRHVASSWIWRRIVADREVVSRRS